MNKFAHVILVEKPLAVFGSAGILLCVIGAGILFGAASAPVVPGTFTFISLLLIYLGVLSVLTGLVLYALAYLPLTVIQQ